MRQPETLIDQFVESLSDVHVPGSPLLMACSRSVSGQRPCSACLPPALPAWVASCVRLLARSGGEAIFVCFVPRYFFFWRGGGGSTTRGHRNDLEVSRAYGNTQFSTSRMLRKYLVYETPRCTNDCAYLPTTQSSHSWWKGRLSMANHAEGPPAYHEGRRSAYSFTNSWAPNRFNLYERPVQLNLHERLRALDLRVSHSPCLR